MVNSQYSTLCDGSPFRKYKQFSSDTGFCTKAEGLRRAQMLQTRTCKTNGHKSICTTMHKRWVQLRISCFKNKTKLGITISMIKSKILNKKQCFSESSWSFRHKYYDGSLRAYIATRFQSTTMYAVEAEPNNDIQHSALYKVLPLPKTRNRIVQQRKADDRSISLFASSVISVLFCGYWRTYALYYHQSVVHYYILTTSRTKKAWFTKIVLDCPRTIFEKLVSGGVTGRGFEILLCGDCLLDNNLSPSSHAEKVFQR